MALDCQRQHLHRADWQAVAPNSHIHHRRHFHSVAIVGLFPFSPQLQPVDNDNRNDVADSGLSGICADGVLHCSQSTAVVEHRVARRHTVVFNSRAVISRREHV